jgi:lysyl-tRNA synthetase class 2
MENRYINSDKTYNGRIGNIRHLGNLCFVDVLFNGKLVQGVLKKELLKNGFPKKEQLHKGDIISITGSLDPSEKREQSIDVTNFSILSKNNSDSLIIQTDENLRKRSEMNYQIRTFLRDKGYIEVEFPILHKGKIPSKSREFSTSHITLEGDLNLRKSADIFLRRIALRGLDQVYSIGPNFRNEYISKDKLPEFNMLSLIKNYSTTDDLILLSKELIDFIFKGENPDLSSDKVETISYEEFVSPFRDLDNPYNQAKANLRKPLVIYKLPLNTNSIAHRLDDGTSDEFKLIIEGHTIVHGYSELNNPLELRSRLYNQGYAGEAGDLEELLKDMEKGCPPASSMGLSLDRLSMLLCEAKNIKETIAFPFSRLEKQNG